MTPDLLEMEANLGELRPAPLDAALLARLSDAADGELTRLSPAETQFEATLRGIQPHALPPAFMAAMTVTLANAPVPASQPSIIPFPKSATAPVVTTRQRSRSMVAAAAAVALLGAAIALLVPGHDPRQPATVNAPAPNKSTASAKTDAGSDKNFVPAAFNTGVSQASDEGVVWQADNQPRRVVKVVHWDRVTFVNPEGKKIECEKPRVEYIYVPENID